MDRDCVIDTAAIDKIFAAFDTGHRPGLAVGIAHRGQPVYRRAFGVASVEAPVLLTPSTRMRIFSITKHMTALAILLLAEEGKLSISDSIQILIPKAPDWMAPVTLEQLMGHISGVPCAMDVLHLFNDALGLETQDDTLMTLFQKLPHGFAAPGESFLYNNGTFAVLTTVVERASGQVFADFVRERMLVPLAMHDSYIRPLDSDCPPNTAIGHVPDGAGGYRRGNAAAPPTRGHGGLSSTINDMLRWIRNLAEPVVGTEEIWARMTTPLRLSNGTATGYGLGLRADVYRGLSVVHHAGGGYGGTSQMIRVVKHDLDIVILSNTAEIDSVALGNAVIDACITGLDPVPAPFEATPLVGRYHCSENGWLLELSVANAEQGLRLQGVKLPSQRIDAVTIVADVSVALQADIIVTATGDVAELCLWGVNFTLHRLLDDIQPVTKGHYECRSLGLSANVDGNAMTLSGSIGSNNFNIVPVSASLAVAEPTVPSRSRGFLIEHDADSLSITALKFARFRFERSVDKSPTQISPPEEG
jgi:D-aminopeptidase